MEREAFLRELDAAFQVTPAVALIGPRQCGKTWLARQVFAQEKLGRPNYFDLEDPEDLQRLANPKLALQPLSGLIIIDEIQRTPELFPTLRVLIDEAADKKRFLILGSASRDLIRQSSETLAGRITFLELTPFSLGEVPQGEVEELWIRGGYPRSFLAEGELQSFQWRNSYVQTFVEKDIPQLGFNLAAQAVRRFWQMLVHYHGQILNLSELGTSFGIADTTTKNYLDILAGCFMIRVLQPWHENIGKRQVKRPKIYFRDSGLLHYFLNVKSREELLLHPKLGASWEGFALEETARMLQRQGSEPYFWGVHSQGELDLFTIREGKRLGFEFKYAEAPTMTKSMHLALTALKLDHLYVVYPGTVEIPLLDNVTAVPLVMVK